MDKLGTGGWRFLQIGRGSFLEWLGICKEAGGMSLWWWGAQHDPLPSHEASEPISTQVLPKHTCPVGSPGGHFRLNIR